LNPSNHADGAWQRDLALIRRLFPFCFTVGHDGTLLALGNRWASYAPDVQIGMPFSRCFRVARPLGVVDQNDFGRRADDVFVLSLADRPQPPFRGQFVPTQDGTGMPAWHFVGGPWLASLAELHRHDLTFRDFPPHDPRGDMLVLLQTQESSLQDLRKLNEHLQERMDRQAALEGQIRQIQKMELVGRLAGGLAHNFNNILMTVSSHADLALMQLPAGDPLRESLEQILGATEQATSLTRGLISMSRKHPVKIVDLDLAHEIAELRKLTEPLLGKQTQLELKIEAGLPPFAGDRSTLQQILMNLVLNARDAMSNGGAICIEVKKCKPLSGPSPEGDMLQITVRDQGHGMDEATKARLFEPFFTTKGPDRGVGLGLSTVFGLVTQFGGTIDVDSSPGNGATFSILLPYRSTTQAVPPATKSAPPESASERVVLVDDDALVRRPLEMLLKRAGYVVKAFGNAEDALAAIAAGEQFEILVTDVVMPGKNGVQFVAELEGRGVIKPTIFISGHHDEADLRSGAMPTHQRFLAKPFSADELVRMIRELKQRQSAAG
jgi:signal transduction histidine kinase/CheY-like chemotaxis protein